MSFSPYAPAARLLNQVWTKRESLKTLAYDSKTGQLNCSKATYAQVCHVLESQRILDIVVAKVLSKTDIHNKALGYVLLYELLLGPNQSIRGGGGLKRTLEKHKQALRQALEETQSTKNISKRMIFPRYVRVNTWQTTSSNVIQILQDQNLSMYCDVHVPDLLVLPPLTKLRFNDKNDLMQSNQVVLQDKSSCFSALCLIHGGNDNDCFLQGDVLDACAAPGNKTSHVAALLHEALQQKSNKTHGNNKNQTTVFALDRSSSRFAMLQRRMQQLVPTAADKRVKVTCQHTDFLKTKPSDYPNLRGILLDPSCSGSGIYTSPDRHEETTTTNKRLESLSNFQWTCLKHAMSFPQVTRIVYSTCSLHDVENEGVVAQAIAHDCDWEIVAPTCLRHWSRRGHATMGLTAEQAQCLIRANANDDTNGFFVCYLERKKAQAKEPAAAAIESGPIFDPPEGISFYNGEFSPNNIADEENAAVENGNESAGPCAKEPIQTEPNKKSLNKKAINKSQDAEASSTCKNAQVKISKKRAKKLAWKKRQMEQKLQRLNKKKKQKVDHDNKC